MIEARRTGIIGGALLCAVWMLGAETAQPSALLNSRDTVALFRRALELMEAATVATPELSRAGAPVIENARQALINLQKSPSDLRATYSFITNLRAYMALADAVPKPFPFPEEARRQLGELRDTINRAESHFRALLDLKESQLRSADRDNLQRYAEANLKLPAVSPAKPRVVFLGDSITDLWRLDEYFPDRDFVNRAISGQISDEMLGRMKADVIDLKPATVVILAGTNDLARGIPLTVIENNYAMLFDLAAYNKIKVVFASVLPVSDYHKDADPAYERTTLRPPVFIRALNEWLQSFCSQNACIYLDYYSALADNNGFLKPDLSDDGLHPNSKGYRVMAPLLLAAVDKALPPVQQKPKRRRLFGR